MEKHLPRKLAAILHADVVGYSRLAGEDEDTTHRRLKESLGLISRTVTSYHGRVINYSGDAVLAMFEAALDALSCAVAIQHDLAKFNRDIPDDRKLQFRIGVNMGDVIEDGGDIFGDGVNVAARLEGLAEPGGICIAESVHTAVGSKLPLDYEDIGFQSVKNISEPKRAYRVSLKPGTKLPRPSEAQKPNELSIAKRRQSITVALVVVLLIVGGTAYWFKPWTSQERLASVENMAFSLPDKPSIAVLPFDNISNDPNQEIFVDGLTEDLITDLSKISGLFVIARNSTFIYKGKPVEIRTVAEDLGVRYVLEGSVRREGGRLRVNAQLIDAMTGGHIWADRFDGDVTNIFDVQDEFVLKIVKALAVELSESEKSEMGLGNTDNIEAREAFQRGWELFSKFNAHDNAKAESHFQKAIELDPEFGRARAALALVYYRGYRFSWEQQMGGSWDRLRRLTADTLIKGEQYPTPLLHVVAALEHVHFGRADQARIEAAQAIAKQPNDPEAHIAMAFAMIISGRPREGLNFIQAAMRLNPIYTSNYVFAQGVALFAVGNLEEAAITLEEGITRNPKAIELLPILASVYAQLQRRQEARDTVLKWRLGSSQLAPLQNAPDSYRLPIRWELKHKRVRERLFDGLRVAVLPLDVTVSSLRGELKDAAPFDRTSIIRTLGWFGPSAAVAVPDLIEELGGELQQVRAQAASTLGKIGPKARAAIPALTAISDDVFVTFHAKKALKEIIDN